MDVHPVGVEREVSCVHLLVVDGHEHQVDVGLCPYLIVGQAAAKDRGQDGAVLLYLLDERLERSGELLADGFVFHVWSSRTLVKLDSRTLSTPGFVRAVGVLGRAPLKVSLEDGEGGYLVGTRSRPSRTNLSRRFDGCWNHFAVRGYGFLAFS